MTDNVYIHYMNKYPLLALAGMAIAPSMVHATNSDNHENGPKKPMNIIYIMCDDHSYQTISAYDNRFEIGRAHV